MSQRMAIAFLTLALAGLYCALVHTRHTLDAERVDERHQMMEEIRTLRRDNAHLRRFVNREDLPTEAQK